MARLRIKSKPTLVTEGIKELEKPQPRFPFKASKAIERRRQTRARVRSGKILTLIRDGFGISLGYDY
jgi:hypothetical protein